MGGPLAAHHLLGLAARAETYLVPPLVTEDISEGMLVSNHGNTVVAVVRRHDRECLAINDGPLERWQIGGAKLALTAVDGGTVDALLWRSKRGLVRKSQYACACPFVRGREIQPTKCFTVAATPFFWIPLT